MTDEAIAEARAACIPDVPAIMAAADRLAVAARAAWYCLPGIQEQDDLDAALMHYAEARAGLG